MTGSHPKYEALNRITENLDNSIFLSSIFVDPQDQGRYKMEMPMETCYVNTALAPHYTDTEEKWLDDRMVAYDVIMKGVSFGEKAIEEFARFTLDEPLSRGFLPNSIHIFKVRREWRNAMLLCYARAQKISYVKNTN